MTDYILEHEKGSIIATYSKAGKLKKIIAKKGVLDFVLIDAFIPDIESDITIHHASGGTHTFLKPYTPVKDDFFTKAQKAWFEFYQKRSGLEYRFTKVDGGALKSIGKHLVTVSGDSFEALQTWKYMLNNWDQLDTFYRNNADLKFINSQLNKILNLLKNGKQTSQGSTSANNGGLRRKVKA
ncbi:MAG: hypothetical protein N4A74_21545 [Carboxylicivirga sp.]|jgi:hypothetical protein|nr:hypothetical protein [Carboxylicivirga sp.]